MKLSQVRLLLYLVVVLAAVIGCGGAAEPILLGDSGAQGDSGPRGAPGAKGDTSSGNGSATTPQDRLIVRNADVTIFADNVSAAMEAIVALASETGGFVVNSRISGEQTQQKAFVSIRVPTDAFEDAMRRIRSLAAKVETENTDAKDVTEEYVDLQAQLRNLQATEQQYQRLMEKATTVDDILKVQRELTSVQGQIERLQGRIQYLEQTSSTSLINVTIRATVAAQPIVRPGWRPGDTAREATRDLADFAQGLADLGIRLLIFSPVWATVLAAVALLLRWQLRRDRASRTPPPGQSPRPPGQAAP